MYQQQAPPPNVYRLRPVSASRSASKQQRRSVAVTSDLHRYYTPPASTIYLPQTLPINQPFHAPSTVSGSTLNHHRHSRPKLPAAQRLNNASARVQPAPFPTISVEKSGTLARQPRRETPKQMVEAESSSATNAASHFLNWFRKRPPPKPTSQPPPPLNNRSNWTGSLPRNFSIRLPPNASNRPVAQKAKVTKAPTKPNAPLKQSGRPGPSRVNFADVDTHYDNAPLSSGYYNVLIGPPSNLTPSQEETASKYATISRRNLPRYNPTVTGSKSNFNSLQRKPAPLPPQEPPPDYSDSRSSSSSISPVPAPRVRFNLNHNLDEEPVMRGESKKDLADQQKQPVPVSDCRERLTQPRGLLARTFERKIYKKLKPIIQIRGIRADEKELGRRPSRTKSPPPQRSILTNGRKDPAQQNKVVSSGQPVTFARTKRPAPLPPVDNDESKKVEPLPRLSSPYDNSSAENSFDLKSKNGAGVCYVEGNRIEYRLEWSGDQLLVHYESRNLNDELRNTADSAIIADLLAESEKMKDLALPSTHSMAILPQRGTLTDIEYGPGLVKRLREKFTQMAKQSGSTIAATNYKRFSSMDDIVSSECSETGVSQTLPRMKSSKSASENLSSTTTGYSSEENSSQTSEQVVPQTLGRFPRTSIECEPKSVSINSTHMDPTVSRVVILDEVDENTAPRIPIRSLREKFESQAQPDRDTFSPRSNSAHTVARYHVSPVMTQSFSNDMSQHQLTSFNKSPTFATTFVNSATLPRTLKHNDYSLTKETPIVDIIRNGGTIRSSSPALSSDLSQMVDEAAPETSDDLESLASHDDYSKMQNIPLTPPHSANEKFWNTNDTLSRSLGQRHFGSLPNRVHATLPIPDRTEQQQTMADQASKRRVTFNLPLDRPVLRKNADEQLVGRPGSTPINEVPEKMAALKDASAMLEVHRLLNKFNAKRVAEQQQEEAIGVVTKKYDSPPSKLNAAEKPPFPQYSFGTPTQPPSNGPTPARKSLSARYLESKQQQGMPVSYSEMSTELNTISENITPSIDCMQLASENDENTSISSMDSLDILEEVVDCQPSFETMFATECGPVRQSLLNLVLQDDIPTLMEAMAENLHFVFEDYSPPMATTHGIILKRRATGQKQARTQNRICFANELPQVFTYLDESSALEESQWMNGRQISYEEYLKLVGDTHDQTARQAIELQKWRTAMQMKLSDQNDNALKTTTAQLAQASLHPPIASSPSSSRTPTPDEIDSFGSRYPFGSSSPTRPVPLRECGTSAI